MDGILRNRRFPAVVLWLLFAAPSAEAQEFVCRPIAPNDTAPRLARQLTGNADAAYTSAFQILDPARGMFVPKSHYRHLSTKWQACVARVAVADPLLYPLDVASAAPAVVLEEPAITSAPLPLASARIASLSTDRAQAQLVVVAATGGAVLLMLLIGVAVADSFAPHSMPPAMLRAGEEFVSAFARPLIDSSSSVPPIHVRLRFVRRKDQLEISIAPGAGRRYPNLIDHKRNVEYDVNRVIRLLGTRVIVSDRLRSAGRWVIVPIRLADPTQAGAK